jgi:hypothetical protein
MSDPRLSDRLAVVGDPKGGFVFTHPLDTAGLHLEWSDLEAEIDPHFGAALPALRCQPLIDARRIAWGPLG